MSLSRRRPGGGPVPAVLPRVGEGAIGPSCLLSSARVLAARKQRFALMPGDGAVGSGCVERRGLPDFVTDLVTALEMYDTPLDMRETTSIYGVDPTPLTAWVRQRFAGAAAN